MRAKGKKPAPARASSSAAPSGPTAEPILVRVDALAEILRRHELNEIEVEEGGVRIYVRRGAAEGAPVAYAAPTVMHAPGPAAVPTHAPAPTASGAPPSQPTSSTDTSDGNVAYVTSPFVGTFYRSPSPDSAPFVDVGTRIKKGQVLCIVEAMKLMNEIEAEIEGSIVQILVENGQAVEYGEPLFKIKVG
jgi:acetyl-CoA carboxylase biotin carboxyl carrier protein